MRLKRPLLPALAAWSALPREARDTLFLLGVIGGIVLLQAPYLSPLNLALAGAVLVWRSHLAWRSRPLPARGWRLLTLLVVCVSTWWTHRTLWGHEAGSTLVVLLLTLKTLELRAQRDAFVVFFLGFFALLTHMLHSQSLLSALGIALALWGLLTGLVNAHLPVGKPPLWQAARLALLMTALGAPLMAVLFALFPRLPPPVGHAQRQQPGAQRLIEPNDRGQRGPAGPG